MEADEKSRMLKNVLFWVTIGVLLAVVVYVIQTDDHSWRWKVLMYCLFPLWCIAVLAGLRWLKRHRRVRTSRRA